MDCTSIECMTQVLVVSSAKELQGVVGGILAKVENTFLKMVQC